MLLLDRYSAPPYGGASRVNWAGFRHWLGRGGVGLSPIVAVLAIAAGTQDLCGRDAGTQPFSYALSVQSEVVDNASGGIETGSLWDHFARLDVGLDGAAMGLPKGSRFTLAVQRVESQMPSANRIGDAQVASNLEAPSRGTLRTLSFELSLPDGWEGAVGLLSADESFDAVGCMGLFLNSSFGVQPTWSGNTIAPIFPTSGIGALASWSRGAWTSRSGVFQANPNDRSHALSQGALLIQEVEHHAAADLKLGIWSYSPGDALAADLPPAAWGGYVAVDRPLGEGRGAPVLFFRVGASPVRRSAVSGDLQIGVTKEGPFASRPHDQLGFGIASADYRGRGVETAYEATYRYVISNYVALQPDIQYIDNPGGVHRSAVVAILRLSLSL
ncbi:carbohydrate-selective porin, OprB family [mine drainage metagenome]|uniref:Carbohydrate-selective porin, OprB family n=1 Tax=mine drainage metagenome TaxID=410659 RepID=A0A1J5SMV1_9ZZZZ